MLDESKKAARGALGCTTRVIGRDAVGLSREADVRGGWEVKLGGIVRSPQLRWGHGRDMCAAGRHLIRQATPYTCTSLTARLCTSEADHDRLSASLRIAVSDAAIQLLLVSALCTCASKPHLERRLSTSWWCMLTGDAAASLSSSMASPNAFSTLEVASWPDHLRQRRRSHTSSPARIPFVMVADSPTFLSRHSTAPHRS